MSHHISAHSPAFTPADPAPNNTVENSTGLNRPGTATPVPGAVAPIRFSSPPAGPNTGSCLARPLLGYRVARLFVVRESDEQDKLMFEGMIAQTYQPHAADPRVSPILTLGMTPLEARGSLSVTGPDGQQETILVERITRGRTVAVLFSYRGCWHLWSMASAATETEAGLNAFTQILIEVIERLHPIELVAANVSRLVRSDHQANLLQAAMHQRVDVVLTGQARFDLAGPNAHIGRLLFAVLAMMAAMERDWIVQRVTAGMIARWRRGLWPRGRQFVPFGYRVTAEGLLMPRPELRDNVRQMMLVLSSDIAPSQKQQELAQLGVMTQRNRRGAKQSTVDVLHSPFALERRLNACAAIYIQGEYLYRHANPFRELDEMAGVPIQRHDSAAFAALLGDTDPTAPADSPTDPGTDLFSGPDTLLDDVMPGAASARLRDNGELQMLCRVPVPEGGWAEQEVLDRYTAHVQRLARQAIADQPSRRLRPLSTDVEADSVNPSLHDYMLSTKAMIGGTFRKDTGRGPAQARATISPLTGRRWADEAYEYEMNIAADGKYAVRRWPVGTQRGDLAQRTRGVPLSEQNPDRYADPDEFAPADEFADLDESTSAHMDGGDLS